jgi:quinol monooxygenase YgiN
MSSQRWPRTPGRRAAVSTTASRVGADYVVVVDEWESPEHFEKFFANPDLQAHIAASGAAQRPPEITIAEAITSPDQY